MGRAVVLGASMAGLLAARVLSDHAEEVVVIERDAADTGYEPRPGVPQGSQVHALLPAGQVQLERWFPGFAEEALAAGAVVPSPSGTRMYVNGVLQPPPQRIAGSGIALVTTRPFLEAMVRRRTTAIANIRILHGRAEGVVFTGDRATGVRYRPTGESADADATIQPADLVVDAMGRSSRLSDWLEENGWVRPPMQRMPIKLNYATAMFRRDEQISDISVVVSQTRPAPDRVARIGGINAVEDNRWIMLISGYADDRPSRDPAEFAARCRRDFPSVFGYIAEQAEMLGDVITYHQADSRRREFHELERFPAGLVAIGDAVASFNPVYGQGMTSAALHASCLSAYLRGEPRLDEPAREYFDKVRVVVDAAWQVSTLADLALPRVDGPYPPGYALISKLGDMVLAMSAVDPEINRRMSMVTTMLAHPSTLARPSTLVRAVGARLRTGLRSRASAR
ncbi:FAD-dependent oxidoreductase [Pseudonocardia xinjiangensis]|uniref:FAD-dependent oxidoreductase n=1 Tax=Pseudonocardia xinjiangensis TaxID=75289 RepID=A0ABX1RDG1_9PSEU|nr:FAD-dependent oxidoreductase [Pseudonocardia xinjiangensis]NMH77186.1 FAD-dependent oxidoreductase [Pseudonocardia xinjiangensis]